jgi:hypothetical protein
MRQCSGADEAALLGEPFQHRQRARQHRRHRDRQLLPGHALLLAHLELARQSNTLQKCRRTRACG